LASWPASFRSVPHRTEFGLALFLGVALTIAVLAGRRQHQPVATYEPPSTYLSGPTGGQAPYEVLAQLGIPEERRRTPLFDIARQVRRRPAALLVVSPEESLEPAELEAVARFVATGGTLVGVSHAGGLTRCVGWGVVPVELGTHASADSAVAVPAGISLDSAPVALPAGLTRLPDVRWVLRPRPPDSINGPSKADVERGVRSPRARQLRDLARCRVGDVNTTDTLLSTRGGAPVVVRLRYRGGGAALLVADDAYFRNAAWRYSDVPEFLVPLLDPVGRGRLSWDEYHHGNTTGNSIGGAVVAWMSRSPIGWALLQWVAVALVWLGVAAVRFGPPRPVIDRRRRSPLEHVEALAVGLEGAGGFDTGVALMVSGLRRRLSRTGRPPRGDARTWLAALQRALSRASGRQAARRLQESLTNRGGAERLLDAAQAVEDVWEELRPRETPAEFSTP
jgi:hypothetical protein